jgi:hypothetical protein
MKAKDYQDFQEDSILDDADYSAVAELDDELLADDEPVRRTAKAGKGGQRAKNAGKQLAVLDSMVPGRDLSAYITPLRKSKNWREITTITRTWTLLASWLWRTCGSWFTWRKATPATA